MRGAQWKNPIYEKKKKVCLKNKKKPEKSCLLSTYWKSAWLLYFCRTVFVSWWRSIFIGRQFVSIWCLVEHSSVRTHTETLAHLSSPCPAPPLPPDPPTVTQAPPPTKKGKKNKGKKAPVPGTFFLQGCLQCLRFLSVWEDSELLALLLPPAPHLPFSRPSGVCVKCTLPWFFFIQYSVTCLCKFGLEKNKSFYETICPGKSLLGFMRW